MILRSLCFNFIFLKYDNFLFFLPLGLSCLYSPLLFLPLSLPLTLSFFGFFLAADSKTVPYPSSSEHYYMGRVYICWKWKVSVDFVVFMYFLAYRKKVL